MKYMGSKNRIAKEILPIILKDRKENQYYIEPFVGGANIIDKVKGRRIGLDINKYLIALLKEISMGWNPPKIVTEDFYKKVKDNPNKYPDYIVGFVGICCSFGAKWFGGYARGKKNNGESRNYALESFNNLMKQAKNISGVNFICIDYKEFKYPENSLIYCDPPYESTTKYKDDFNHTDFWNWVRKMSADGHIVFVSEYNAPDDFEIMWEKQLTCSIQSNAKKGEYKKSVERLFRIKDIKRFGCPSCDFKSNNQEELSYVKEDNLHYCEKCIKRYNLTKVNSQKDGHAQNKNAHGKVSQ